LKSEDAFVRFTSLKARLALSNIAHASVNGVGLLPEAHERLLLHSSVVLETPEHRRPVAAPMPRQASGTSFVIGPGSGGVDTGIYEVKADVPTYGGVLGSVSFRLNPTWVPAARYWSSLGSLLPLYLGFEYGVRNTGLFVAFRDAAGTGTLVAGGPMHAFNGARPLQSEYVIDWQDWAGGDIATVLFEVNSDTQEMTLWLQAPGSDVPVVVDSFLMGQLGEFDPSSSSFAQKRSGATLTATLYFGNGGGISDQVEIVDYAIFPKASWSVLAGSAEVGHVLKCRPDLPATFFSTEKKLPDARAIGRWLHGGNVPPSPSFWYQPGRRTVPLYTKIPKLPDIGIANSFLYRKEPHIAQRNSGFSVEAWMAGTITDMRTHDTGLGIRVQDGEFSFALTALDTQIIRSWGILKDAANASDWNRGFITQVDGDGNLRYSDHRALRLVRLSADREHDRLQVFVEDMDEPLITAAMSDVTIPATNVDGVVEIGHLTQSAVSGEAQIAAISYLNQYSAWEKQDDPQSSFTVESSGDSDFLSDGVSLRIQKLSYGPVSDKFIFFKRAEDLTFLRGCQVDFRTKVTSYTDVTGISGATKQWTGGGVTLFFGSAESPQFDAYQLHVGFFDCGSFGRKIAIMPGEDGLRHIIGQTELGQLYSASANWGEMSSYRLVYRPYDRIEVYGPGLIMDAPLISIPWDKYIPQRDFAELEPAITFGAFSNENNCLSEWEFLRWGVSSGYEVELLQQPSEDLRTVFDGRVFLYVEAEELVSPGV
jgi:hypothetical protein